MQYELEWLYADDPAPEIETEPYIHFLFMLRFPDLPPGTGHSAIFCFNVLQNPQVNDPGISVIRRGFLVCVPYSKREVQEFVEAEVAKAALKPRDEALVLLNTQFINDSLDFSDEFKNDLLEADELLNQIEKAFDGIDRGDGITLHQAVVIDNYGTVEEYDAAGKLDTENRWQEVPDEDISSNTSIFSYLDPKGFRYYLPAAMSWAVKNYEHDDHNCAFYTYLAVLPTVAPRNVGRGIGAKFDSEAFIEKHFFTSDQVKAIYRFICFIAIRAGHRMREDQYEAVKKWRLAAQE